MTTAPIEQEATPIKKHQLAFLHTSAFQVLFFSFAILFLEASLFSALMFTHTYLVAMQSIAFALLGLGIGALIAGILEDALLAAWIPWFMLGKALSIMLLFVNIALFP